MTELWTTEPGGWVCGEREAHLWVADLDPEAAEPRRWEALLSEAERGRAQRFHFDRDRNRYIVSHGILRRLLGYYVGVAPDRIRFETETGGKPSLAREHAASGLRFNLSHADGWALYGLTKGRRIGVDLERHRRPVDARAIAQRHFAAAEWEALRTLPEAELARAFFACWTRKEAYLKALGSGLGYPLGRFEVTTSPAAAPAIVRDDGDPDASARWTVVHLEPAPEFVGAAVVEGQGLEIRRLRWRSEPA